MHKRSKISVEEKVEVAVDCIEGRIGIREAARKKGVNKETIRDWIRRYETEGSLGLQSTTHNRIYSEKMKRQAVEDYLAGKGSLREICKKHKIRSKIQLQNWIKVYNRGGDFKHKMSGGSRMKNTRKTTQEERIRIASASRAGTTMGKRRSSIKSVTSRSTHGSKSSPKKANPVLKIAAVSARRSRNHEQNLKGCKLRTPS